MELYLIRHGIAGEVGTYLNDAERPLTDRGREKTIAVAKRLAEIGLAFDVILTSPLVRARQTAEILVKAKLSDQYLEHESLTPEGDIQSWLEWFHHQPPTDTSCYALVGHQPNLAAWAEVLLWGKMQGKLTLKKAGVIGLTLPVGESPVGKSELFLLSSPRFLI